MASRRTPPPPAPTGAAAGLLLSLLLACTGGAEELRPDYPIGGLRFVGEQRIAHRLEFEGTRVGGLSGLDYDGQSGEWIAISDDKGVFGPPRAYRLKLASDAAPEPIAVVPLRQRDGSPYPGNHAARLPGGEIPDFESIRIDPADGTYWHASEGDAANGTPPFIRRAERDGAFKAELPLAPRYRFAADGASGVRRNAALEGLTFTPDGETLWTAMEGPLVEDGPLPDGKTGALARIAHLRRDGSILREVVYRVDPIPFPASANGWADNGISELLAISTEKLLVIERSGAQNPGQPVQFHVRIYEIDVSRASDVSNMPALRSAALEPVRKTLLLNLDELGLARIDNLECLAWGPRQPNGHATLVLASDDNFAPAQVTQFLFFEVLPAAQ